MHMGYPLLYTRTASLGVEYMRRGEKAGHIFNGEGFIPGALNSGNGTGSDLLLEEERGSWFRWNAGYRLSMSLMQKGDFRIYHGIATGMLYERRSLNYQSNSSEITTDLNIYLGPSLQTVFTINDDWQLSGRFDNERMVHFKLDRICSVKLSLEL